MPSEKARPGDPATGRALFLLPHQDDEFGVFALLERNVREGVACTCVYLTDGGGGRHVPPSVRDAESRRVLGAIGISPDEILFLSLPGEGRAKDGRLFEAMPQALDALCELMAGRDVGSVYTPAWEGGHPDHDAAALIAAAFARRRGIPQVWQFPLYNAYRAGRFPYRVFNPIPSGGPIERVPTRASALLRYARYCLSYRSQRRTFAALLPLVVYRLARDRYQSLQRIQPSQFTARPHQGALLYERRNWLSWSAFEAKAAPFIDTHTPPGG